MKELYISPEISVEELEKFDILCASAENVDPVNKDNTKVDAGDLGDLDLSHLL